MCIVHSNRTRRNIHPWVLTDGRRPSLFRLTYALSISLRLHQTHSEWVNHQAIFPRPYTHHLRVPLSIRQSLQQHQAAQHHNVLIPMRNHLSLRTIVECLHDRQPHQQSQHHITTANLRLLHRRSQRDYHHRTLRPVRENPVIRYGRRIPVVLSKCHHKTR